MKKITLWLIALFACWQLSAQSIVIGTATTTTTSIGADPIHGYYNAFKYQVVYTAAELNASLTPFDEITGLGFSIAGDYAGGNLLGYTIKMGHTTATNSATHDNSITTVVKNSFNYNPSVTAAGVFDMITFDTNFVWNGVDNVLVEICSDGPNPFTGPYGQVRANTTVTNGSRYYRVDDATACGIETDTANGNRPNIQFNYIDGTPPSCLPPSGLNATSVIATTATINWIAQTPAPSVGYEYFYSTVNTTPTVAGTPTTATTANLTGLMANTLYYVWVRSDCGSGQSAWSPPFTFRTTCDINTAPWLYNVESATLTTNSNVLDCWSSIPNNTTSAFRWNVDGDGGTPSNFSTGPNGAYSGVKYFYVEASSGNTGAIAELYTPLVNINTLASPSLQFYYHMFGATIGELHVDVYNGSAWINDVDVIIGQQQAAQTDPWINRIVNLAAFSGTIQVRFRAIRGSDFDGDISLDDINFTEGPSCYSPTNLTVYNITATTADLNWTENATAFDWEYVVQAPGTGVPTTSGIAIDAKPYEVASGYGITGLTPSTNYEVYLRSSCSVSDKSTWFGPVNFKTECAIFTVPSLENFTTYIPNCWEEASNGDLVSGPSSFGDNDWYADGFGNVGTTGSASFEIWLASANDWLITPTYAVPATGYELKFDAAATQWNSTAAPSPAWEADDFVQVLISTTGTSNWTVLYTYNNTNVPAPAGTPNVIDLDAYAGQNVKFAFRVVEGNSDGSADLNFYVDNFEIRLTPTLPPLCATNVVATPNASCGNFATAITWNSVSGANGYRVNIGTSTGATDVLNNFDLGTALSYNHIGSVNTNYFVTILPYNSNGNAIGCSEITYMTNVNGCYCPSLPTSNDGNGITNVLLASTNFPTTDVTYFDHTATSVTLAQGVNSNLQITFATGYTYNTYVYIDFNNDFDFTDLGELVFTGQSASSNPTTYNASFMMPTSAPLGNHRMRIVTADDLGTSNPCYSGSYGVTLDFTINVIAPSCMPPAFSSANIIHDCLSSSFNINVNITGLGNGTPTITNGVSTWPVNAIGNVQVGPFTYGTPVTLILNHGSDNVCNVAIGTYNYATCPPANDECSSAQSLTPGIAFATNAVIGSNVGATNSTAPAPGCASYSGGDVWYQVAIPASGSLTIETNGNSPSALADSGMAVYSGSCGSLVLIECDDDDSSDGNFSLISLTGRSAGEIVYVRVWEYGNDVFGQFRVSAYDASLSTDTFDATSFKAYPNPVKDILTLEYTTSISSVRIMNLLGQEVISRNINANDTKIDMSQLNSGAYIVNVVIDDKVQSIKVIKE